MIRAVIWDVDGTLIDSEPLHLKALKAVCAAHRVDISDLPDDRFIGVNLHGVWAALKDRFPATLAMADWIDALNKAYAANARELIEIPQASMVIKHLSGRGIRQVAVSNSNRAVVDVNLTTLGIAGLLEFSLSLDDVRTGKPDPEPYLTALFRLGLFPDQALAVEDSHTGVRSAKAAGIAVAGFGDLALEADHHVTCLGQISELITMG